MTGSEKTNADPANISWNDRVSTGVYRVVLYSTYAFIWWRNFIRGRVAGHTDWWDVVFLCVTVFFIFTSATWALRKWLERRKQALHDQ